MKKMIKAGLWIIGTFAAIVMVSEPVNEGHMWFNWLGMGVMLLCIALGYSISHPAAVKRCVYDFLIRD